MLFWKTWLTLYLNSYFSCYVLLESPLPILIVDIIDECTEDQLCEKMQRKVNHFLFFAIEICNYFLVVWEYGFGRRPQNIPGLRKTPQGVPQGGQATGGLLESLC